MWTLNTFVGTQIEDFYMRWSRHYFSRICVFFTLLCIFGTKNEEMKQRDNSNAVFLCLCIFMFFVFFYSKIEEMRRSKWDNGRAVFWPHQCLEAICTVTMVIGINGGFFVTFEIFLMQQGFLAMCAVTLVIVINKCHMWMRLWIGAVC